jgi:hypothetical protein
MRLLPVLGIPPLMATTACDMTMEDVELAGTPASDQKDCEKLGSEGMAQCMETAAADRRPLQERIALE